MSVYLSIKMFVSATVCVFVGGSMCLCICCLCVFACLYKLCLRVCYECFCVRVYVCVVV